MAYPKAYKKFVDKTITQWQKILHLTIYDIVVHYAEKDADSDAESSILINQKYYTATITLYPIHLDIWKNGLPEARKIIVHELTHILVDPLWEFAADRTLKKDVDEFTKIGEQLTETFARILTKNIKE